MKLKKTLNTSLLFLIKVNQTQNLKSLNFLQRNFEINIKQTLIIIPHYFLS